MKILAISWTECSTAAVVVDGHVVACISEERFSRIKNDERYPRRAIEVVLKAAGLQASDLDVVAFAGTDFDAKSVLVHKYSGFSVQDRLREQREYWYPRMYEGKMVDYLTVFADQIDQQQDGAWDRAIDWLRRGAPDQARAFFQQFRREMICQHLGVDPSIVSFVDHHHAHACYAYYGSPFRSDPVAVLTADAWGDGRNATVSLAQGGRITLLSSSDNFQGARLYRSITLMLGMKPDEHEYKVMGLAPYAKPEYAQVPYRVFQETQRVHGLGFDYQIKPADLYVYFHDRLEGHRFDAIASGLQRYTEELLLEWACNALRKTGTSRVVFGGGVAMNVKAMMRIAQLPDVHELFICPSPSDESLAIGSAYVVQHEQLQAHGQDPRSVIRPLPSAYLGMAASPADVEETVQSFRSDPTYRVSESADSARIARLLSEGKILGRCVGRNEFGARALGNRSIVADPRDSRVIRRLNERIKSRDFWMPFAPTILAHCADEYLKNEKGLAAPYMTLAFETSARGRRELAAGVHPADATCRPQVLEPGDNPGYEELITAFERVTGVGAVLNTSFNLHGEPVVQTPADAARVFRLSGLDLLELDGRLIEKVDAGPMVMTSAGVGSMVGDCDAT